MTYDPEEIYRYLISNLTKRKIVYDVHKFTSGAIMLDIWKDNSFYVVQIEEEFAGFSQIDDEHTGFDTVPDIKFFSSEDFKTAIESALI